MIHFHFLFLLLFLSSSSRVRGEGSHCSQILKDNKGELNPDAFATHRDCDFFTEKAHSSRGLIDFGKRAKQAATVYLEGHQGDLALKMQQLGGFSPELTGCAFLRVQFVERAGLGHTLSCWAFYLDLAQQLGLTYHSPFFSAAHETCNLNETAHYFGFHAVYYWANADVIGNTTTTTTTVPVGTDSQPCSLQVLKSVVSEHVRRSGAFSCGRGNTVFVCNNAQEPFTKRESKSVVPWVEPLRGILRFSLKEVGGLKRYLPARFLEAQLEKRLIIVAHIRRGDVLQSRRIDRDHRLMSFGAYHNILRQVLVEIALVNSPKLASSISILLLCEGAKDERHVMEFDQNILKTGWSPGAKRTMYQLDAVAALSTVCNATFNNCSATVLHQADFLQSFSVMCLADVLILGTSGFSWPPAALCRPGLTIGRDHLFMDLQGFDNIVPIVSASLWRDDVAIQLPHLASRLKAMHAHPRFDIQR